MAATIIRPEQEDRIETQIRERRAQFALSFTRYVAWAAGIAAAGIFATWMAFPQFGQLLGVFAVVAIMAVAMGLYPVFHRQGQTAAGVNLVIGSIALTCAVAYILVPDFGLTVVAGGLLIVLMSNMLLGAQNSLLTASGTVLLIAVAAILAKVMSPKWFSPLNETLALIVSTACFVIVFLLAALIVRQNTLDQESYFRQSKLANLEIEERAEA